jgi:hypothetical protein
MEEKRKIVGDLKHRLETYGSYTVFLRLILGYGEPVGDSHMHRNMSQFWSLKKKASYLVESRFISGDIYGSMNQCAVLTPWILKLCRYCK